MKYVSTGLTDADGCIIMRREGKRVWDYLERTAAAAIFFMNAACNDQYSPTQSTPTYVCGNKICERELGETIEICPEDCTPPELPEPTEQPPTPPPVPPPLPRHLGTLSGAGDIAVCGLPGAGLTSRLLDTISGAIFTAGDNAYFYGDEKDFSDCYEPTWGRHKARTRPAPGNHDYQRGNAIPYFTYFGSNAGPFGLGYYSYNIPASGSPFWHIVSLNSELRGTERDSQLRWLDNDMNNNLADCTAVIFHRPLFSSGGNSDKSAKDFWRIMYGNADIVVNGHEHFYERFDPQDPDGVPKGNGIQEIIVGTGGAEATGHDFTHSEPNSVVKNINTWGILKLELYDRKYEWEFVPVDGSFMDSGSRQCR